MFFSRMFHLRREKSDNPAIRSIAFRKSAGCRACPSAPRPATWGTDIPSIRAQEQASSDLKLSDLYRWQQALEVPVSELLVEDDDPLSRPVAERAKMVKAMKTAKSLLETAPAGPVRRMAENLVEQLLDLMPELKEVSGWHTVGQRRSLDELGRIAEQPVSSDFGYCELSE